MRTSTCISSTAAALHRVFIAPIERPQLLSIAHPLFSSKPRSRSFSHTRPRNAFVSDAKGVKSRLPRDHEIEARSVSLVDADGKLHGPRSTIAILQSFDRKTHSLVTVVEGEPGVPPICKIFDKKIMRETEKAAEKAKRKAASGNKQGKTIELNWAIGDGDLGHRMKKMRQFLEKGWKVEMVLAKKRKGKIASVEECEALVKRVRKAREEVEGSKEIKKMDGKMPVEGQVPGEVKLFFQGPKPKKIKAGKEVEVEEDEEEDTDEEEASEEVDGKEGRVEKA